MDLVTAADVEAAARRIEGGVERTPASHSHTLSVRCGCDIVVKLENLQFTASFKERGALNALLQLTDEQRAAGVVCMSAGNHAQGVAYHATRLGIASTVVMPVGTPSVKSERTRVLGAEVILRGDSLAEAAAFAEGIVVQRGAAFIHPYDDPAVVAGQGTVGLELLADRPELDTWIVPVGGGGLISGMAAAAAGSGVEVIGVQSERFPAMAARRRPELGTGGGSTIAEGIAVTVPGVLTGAMVDELVADVVTVPETAIESAIEAFLDIEKVVVEGAGAAGLAALLTDPDRFRGRRVGLVVTGGNIDPRPLAAVLMRSLTRTGRLVRVELDLDDRPGQLAAAADVIGRTGANIVEVHHSHLAPGLSMRTVEVEFTLETLGADHTAKVLDALEGAGHRPQLRDWGPR